MIRKWKRELKREERQMERSIRGESRALPVKLNLSLRSCMGICHYARYTTALLLRDWASTPGGSWTNVPSRAEIEMNQRKTEAEIKKCAAKKDLGRFVVEAIENQARFLNRCAPLVHHTLSLDALLSVVVSAKVLARELVKSRKAKQRLYQTKANLR
jgi:hypothetical protein